MIGRQHNTHAQFTILSFLIIFFSGSRKARSSFKIDAYLPVVFDDWQAA
jgi:hypothetical protein